MRQFRPAAALLLAAAAAPAAASGFYLSAEAGWHSAAGIDTVSRSNDRASACDEYINPRYADTPACTGPRGLGTAVRNRFGAAGGHLLGLAAGWRLRPHLRLELEYFYRDSGYDETSPVGAFGSGTSAEKLAREIVSATERVGGARSHNVFANLYYDFPAAGAFTPYLGAGAGFGFTDLRYRSLWRRNDDPERIRTGADLPNAAEVRRNLAGTYSDAHATLSDTLFGVQLLAGLDYALDADTALGLKARWVRYDSFADEGFRWDPLRSHVPNLRRDGSEPVHGFLRSGDLELFGVSAVLRRNF